MLRGSSDHLEHYHHTECEKKGLCMVRRHRRPSPPLPSPLTPSMLSLASHVSPLRMDPPPQVDLWEDYSPLTGWKEATSFGKVHPAPS